MQVGSPAWAINEHAPPSASQTDGLDSAHHATSSAPGAHNSQISISSWGLREDQPARMASPPTVDSNHAVSRMPSASVSAQLDLLSDMAGMALSHSKQQLQWLHSCDSYLEMQPSAQSKSHSSAAAQASSPMPPRIRSTSDLQHGSSSKEESAEDLRDAQQQAAEAHEELQRLREDRDQLRVALASALSQTQQLGALQSEVSMLNRQLEETRQMTMHSMNRTQSTLSLPYDQVMPCSIP